MKNFKITFERLVNIEYETIIQAGSEEEALKIWNDNPFGQYCDIVDEQGLDIYLINCVEDEE